MKKWKEFLKNYWYTILMIVILIIVGFALRNYPAILFNGQSETCYKGVLYLQFPHGVTVAYKPDGSVITCSGGK
jgi:hypothetical protein